jgi:abhydrolase domain-containing protein 5
VYKMQQRTLTPESPVSKSWWSRMRWRQTSKAEAAEAERALLSLSPARLEATNIPIGTHKEQYLHCIKGGHDDNAASPHLVAVPGYGAGSGFMWRTLEGLSAGFRLWAVDMLGTGLSGRPHFAARSREEAETFFVDSFEKWRAAAGIEKMVLMGHSLGGYLSAVYAIKYPERVQHLVLVCPAGVARRPESWQVPEVVRSPWTLRGQVYRLAKTMWEGGLTPGTFVRTLGPWGPKLLEGYVWYRLALSLSHLHRGYLSPF